MFLSTSNKLNATDRATKGFQLAIVCSVALSFLTLAPTAADDALDSDKLDVDKSTSMRQVLHLCKLDGTPVRPLIKDVTLRHRFDRQGTPDISADGSKIAFDALPWESVPKWGDARIIVAAADGADAKDVSDGVMPSFSPDGKMFAVSRAQKNTRSEGAVQQSIWVMNSDGSDRKMIADQGAWGARWSPDGKSLVFHSGIDRERNQVPKNCLRVYEFDTKKIRNVFSPEESPFSKISFHFDWNKSGREVAFGGLLKKDRQLALGTIDVDMGISSLRLITNDDAKVQIPYGSSMDWHPKDDRIVVTAFRENRMVPYVVKLNPLAEQLDFSRLPEGLGMGDPIYSAKGEKLIAALIAMPNN